jgi:two-component system, OmpR family, response regulator
VRVLIAEDDAATRDLLERGLREELFGVEAVADAGGAERCAAAGGFDAIILDLMLPDMDGFSLCRRLRTRGIDTPILLLTGRHSLSDRVRGLDVGADDYMAKPFAFEELLARLRAVTRRGRSRQLEATLAYGPIEVDPHRRIVTIKGEPVLLSDTEFRLLRYLLMRADELVTREELGVHVWDHEPGASNVIDVYIGYLRRKLGPARPMLRTVRRVGYTLSKGNA